MSNVHGMIRSAYTFDSDVVSNETALDTGEEYVIVDVCIKALNKADLNPSAFMTQKAELKYRIEKMKEDRDAGQSFRVSDVNQYSYIDYTGFWW